MYLEQINILLDTCAPEKIDKYKLRLKSKLWIILGLQKSRSVKNKLLTKLINTKVPVLTKETHIKCKSYRNLVFSLMEKSKQAYHNKYF